MQMTASQDVDAPLQAVFDALSDFDALEARCAANGIDVTADGPAQPGPQGPVPRRWQAAFTLRGKPREATVTLAAYEPPKRLAFDGVSGGLETRTELTLSALSATETRVEMRTELMPQTLSARLLVQSLKLGRAKIETRLTDRMGRAAREIEKRYRDAG